MLHTSGTTSRSKIVPLTHQNLFASARNVQAALALAETDRSLNVMPLFHIHGLVAALPASLAAGGSVVCTPGFDAPGFFEWLSSMRGRSQNWPKWSKTHCKQTRKLHGPSRQHDDRISGWEFSFMPSQLLKPREILSCLQVSFTKYVCRVLHATP